MKWIWFGLCLVADVVANTNNNFGGARNMCTCDNCQLQCPGNTGEIANESGDTPCNASTSTIETETQIENHTVTVTVTIPTCILPTTTAEVASICIQASTPVEVVNTSTQAPANNSNTTGSVTPALAAVTGILFMSLVGVIIGWVVTCFIAIKKGRVTSYKISQERSHDNPTLQQLSDLRGREPSPLPQVNHYSSQGPDYEVIGYSRQAQCAAQPSERTNIETRNPSNEYHELEKVEEHMYHVLENPTEHNQRQMTAAAQVENQEGEGDEYCHIVRGSNITELS